MSESLSPNTQAILLLTAPLIAGRGQTSPDLLTPGEYKRLARRLRKMQRQPADLMSPDASELLKECQPDVDAARVNRLMERGFLLSQAIEHWQARVIWVVSRADPDYPVHLKSRLKEDAPPILYGCGEKAILNSGGLAVVGSRDANEALIEYAEEIGRLAAEAQRTVVSGGARGIDQAAMRGALDAGGRGTGVLADSLEKAAMNRGHRSMLLDGRLVLISPYDPSAGFNVGNAMQRNKLIYALADAALVVNSDFQKGGTWAGAVEQLDKLKLVRVYVRWTGKPGRGLEALRKKGASPWPNPIASDALAALLDAGSPSEPQAALQDELVFTAQEQQPLYTTGETPPVSVEHQSPSTLQSADIEPSPSEELFAKVRDLLWRILRTPRKEAEVAAELNVSTTQVREWLQRLVNEGMLEKRDRPVRYVLKQTSLFEDVAPYRARESGGDSTPSGISDITLTGEEPRQNPS